MSIHGFLHVGEDRQRKLLGDANRKLKLSIGSIEKDVYVCLFLEKVMTLPGIGEHLTFKGGTSLSKAHKITERFSEDVDLVMDRTALGLSDDAIPGPQHSSRQQKERAKKIAKACRTWTADVLLPAMRKALEPELPNGTWSLDLNVDTDNHETVISFRYPRSITTGGQYILEHVKVDLVAKADAWPVTVMPVRAYVNELYPEELGDGAFPVRTLEAERTLIEKALLLHEVLIQRPDGPRPRLARHYFDLYFLHRAGVTAKAITRTDLYAAVVQQRSIYYRYPGVDYDALLLNGFTIIPEGAARDAWQHDYEGMQSDMFYGEVPAFEDILTALEKLQDDFRTHLRSNSTSTPPVARHLS
ncbi:MAG: nucleotidyl transferase AbiEii/AbiGii toxin family protein [Flavobacteriales bacterium]|nr:nucleotidyl transferase AbiEii/AbiGii toxin family protein [Flavobacteriales bacterium]